MTTTTNTWLAAVEAATTGGKRALPPALADVRARAVALRNACSDLLAELEITGTAPSGLLAAITTAHADVQRAAALAAEPVYEPRKCRQCGRAVQARLEDGGCAC